MIRYASFIIRFVLTLDNFTTTGPHPHNAITPPSNLVFLRILYYSTFTQRRESFV